MNQTDFRNDEKLRGELAVLMQNETLKTALALVKSRNELVALPLGASGIDAGRCHEERRTRALVVAELFEMTTALPVEEEPVAGIFHKFDNPEESTEK